MKYINEQDLGLKLAGMPYIDIIDLKNNCEFSGGYNADSDIIKWLFEILQEYDETMKANFLL